MDCGIEPGVARGMDCGTEFGVVTLESATACFDVLPPLHDIEMITSHYII